VVHRDEGIDTIAAITDAGRKDLMTLPGQTLFGSAFSPSGHLLFGRFPDNPGLWAVPFSLERLETAGEPFPMTPTNSTPSVSGDGTLTYVRPPPPRATRIVLVDRQGLVVRTIGDEQEEQTHPALSPAGDRVAISAQEGDNRDIWIHEVGSEVKRRLTFEDSGEDDPRARRSPSRAPEPVPGT
jgi:hypothetical protein